MLVVGRRNYLAIGDLKYKVDKDMYLIFLKKANIVVTSCTFRVLIIICSLF